MPQSSAKLRLSYGSDPSQFAELHRPLEVTHESIVVLIHGGFWGPKYGAELMTPMAEDLAARGWMAWNIEYRRLERGGGFPETLIDVAAAIDYLDQVEDLDPTRVLLVGHSAGGHLAAWAASRDRLQEGQPGSNLRVSAAGAISLAGVVDLRGASVAGIGDHAATRFMGGPPEQFPERYQVADPLLLSPASVPVICVHARNDDRVPFQQSLTYVETALDGGGRASMVEVDGDHFTVIDMGSPNWPIVLSQLEDLDRSW